MNTTEKTRFDTRLPKEQKEAFEYAASLAGFRTLSEFIISSAQQKAEEIIEKHNLILASRKDQKTFFDAIMHPPSPNDRLKKAVKLYNKLAERR